MNIIVLDVNILGVSVKNVVEGQSNKFLVMSFNKSKRKKILLIKKNKGIRAVRAALLVKIIKNIFFLLFSIGFDLFCSFAFLCHFKFCKLIFFV